MWKGGSHDEALTNSRDVGAGISGQVRSGEDTLARVLLPARVRSTQILDPEAQTKDQMQSNWGNGSKQPARLLVDTRSQSSFIRRGLIREKFWYKSAEPKAFYMVDDATKLYIGFFDVQKCQNLQHKKKHPFKYLACCRLCLGDLCPHTTCFFASSVGDYQANAMCVMVGKRKGGAGGCEVIQCGVIPERCP